INSRFKGDNENEAAWFGVSASLPGLSMSGKRAVDQIIRATARGRAEKVLSQPAQLLSLFHGLWPGLTADALGLANQMLPAGHGNADRIIGPHIRKSKVLDSLTVLGQR